MATAERRVRGAVRLIFVGGLNELEPRRPAKSPVDFDRLHRHGDCQLHPTGTRKRDASAVDHLLAAAPACPVAVQRSVLVHAAVRGQVAWCAEDMNAVAARASLLTLA